MKELTGEHAFVHENIGAYLAGGLDAGERSRFDAHINTCPECFDAFSEARDADRAMQRTLGELAPLGAPGELESRLLAGVSAELDKPISRWRHPAVRRAAYATAAAVALAATGVFANIAMRQGGRMSNPLSQAFAADADARDSDWGDRNHAFTQLFVKDDSRARAAEDVRGIMQSQVAYAGDVEVYSQQLVESEVGAKSSYRNNEVERLGPQIGTLTSETASLDRLSNPQQLASADKQMRELQVSTAIADAKKFYDDGKFKESAEALQKAKAVDPQNEKVQLFASLVQDKLAAREYEGILHRTGQETIRQNIDTTEHLIPYADLMVYPDNWPEITRRRENGTAANAGESSFKDLYSLAYNNDLQKKYLEKADPSQPGSPETKGDFERLRYAPSAEDAPAMAHVTGTGGVTKSGSGTTTLSSNNTSPAPQGVGAGVLAYDEKAQHGKSDEIGFEFGLNGNLRQPADASGNNITAGKGIQTQIAIPIVSYQYSPATNTEDQAGKLALGDGVSTHSGSVSTGRAGTGLPSGGAADAGDKVTLGIDARKAGYGDAHTELDRGIAVHEVTDMEVKPNTNVEAPQINLSNVSNDGKSFGNGRGGGFGGAGSAGGNGLFGAGEAERKSSEEAQAGKARIAASLTNADPAAPATAYWGQFTDDTNKSLIAIANPPAIPPAGGTATQNSTAPATRPVADVQTLKIIRNGTLEFEVRSFDDTYRIVARIAQSDGGFVASTSSEKLANGHVRGTIVVRVPPAGLDDFLSGLRALGDLKSQHIGAADVTKDYYDIDSELRGLTTMETRLLELAKNPKGEVKDLAEVEKQLGDVRVRIEKLKGEISYYNNLVSLATITITAYEKDIASPTAASEQENINANLETEEVEAKYTAARKIFDDAKGRIVESQLKNTDAEHIAAHIVADVPPDKADFVAAQLKQLGKVASFTRDRKQTTAGGTGAPVPGVQVEQKDTRFTIELYNLANLAPRETTNLRVAVKDVEASYRSLLAVVKQPPTGPAAAFPAHWDPKLRIPRGQVVAAASIVSPKY